MITKIRRGVPVKKLSFLLFLCIAFLGFNNMPASAITDGTDPVINSIELLTPVVRPGDPVILKVSASDDYAIKNISFSVRSTDNKKFEHSPPISYWEIKEKSLTEDVHSYPLSTYLPDGEWEVYSVLVFDKAGNFAQLQTNDIYTMFGKALTFTVDGDHRAIKDRTYKNLRTKKNVLAKQELKVNFDTPIKDSTINENNVFMLDEEGNDVDIVINPIRTKKREIKSISIKPKKAYDAKSKYTLYVKDIRAYRDDELLTNYKMQFTTK